MKMCESGEPNNAVAVGASGDDSGKAHAVKVVSYLGVANAPTHPFQCTEFSVMVFLYDI